MCMLVFLAANEPLPLIPWDPDRPAFHVRNLVDEREHAVKEHLQQPNVYYTGSHELCGCGFSFGEDPEWEDEDEVRANRASAAQLADYIDTALAAGVSIQLFACEAGNESKPPLHRRFMGTADLRANRFWLRDREVVTFGDGPHIGVPG